MTRTKPMNQETKSEAPRHANGTTGRARPSIKKAPGTTFELVPPEMLKRVEREIQERPLRTLAIAAAIGVGVGALVVSTLGRRALFAGVSYLGRELVRSGAQALMASSRA